MDSTSMDEFERGAYAVAQMTIWEAVRHFKPDVDLDDVELIDADHCSSNYNNHSYLFAVGGKPMALYRDVDSLPCGGNSFDVAPWALDEAPECYLDGDVWCWECGE